MSSASPVGNNTIFQHHFDLILTVFEENLRIEGCSKDEIQTQRKAIKVIFDDVLAPLKESHFKTPLRDNTVVYQFISKAMDGKSFPLVSECDKRIFGMRLVSCLEHFWNSFSVSNQTTSVSRKLFFSDEKNAEDGKEEKKTDSNSNDQEIRKALQRYQEVIATMPNFFAKNYESSDPKKFESALTQLLTNQLVKDVIMTQLREVKDLNQLAKNPKDFNNKLFECLRDVIFPTILNDPEFIKLAGEENTIMIPVAFSEDHFLNILMGVKLSNFKESKGFKIDGCEVGGSFEDDDDEWNVSDFDYD